MLDMQGTTKKNSNLNGAGYLYCFNYCSPCLIGECKWLDVFIKVVWSWLVIWLSLTFNETNNHVQLFQISTKMHAHM